jgi:DNA-binding XRE family transcriptional regulator
MICKMKNLFKWLFKSRNESSLPNHVEQRKRIAQNLLKLRREHKLNRMDVAFNIGVEPPIISHWERGSMEVPYQGLRKLAELFNTTIKEITK